MSFLVDWQIRALSIDVVGERGMIASPMPYNPHYPLLSPFSEGVQDDGVISYGLTSSGYDLRLGNKVKIFKSTFGEMIDPKATRREAKERETYFRRVFDDIDNIKDGQYVVLPPHSYLLAYSKEYIRMPRWLSATCVGKSTYARCGVIVNCTPAEPDWEGHLTIEIGNLTGNQTALYCGEGIAQMRFETLNGVVEKSYRDKDGKYQAQGAEPVAARVKE